MGPMPDVSHDPPVFQPLVVERSTSERIASRPRRPRRHRRASIIGAALALGTAALVVTIALAGADSEPGTESAGAVTATTVTPTGDTGVRSSAPPVATLAPVSAGYPIEWFVVDVGELAPSVSADEPAEGWIDWSVPVPELLAEMTLPSTIVASTVDGVLHRIEFPSGRISSSSLRSSVATGQISIAAGSVAVPRSGGVVIVGSDGSSIVWETHNDRVPRVSTFGSRFMVTVAGADGSDRQWILDPDGTATEMTDSPFGPFAPFPAWDQRFTPAGELLVDDGDAIVVVDPDGGVRRLDEGRLAASGPHHYVRRMCDGGRCDYTIVDMSTGQRAAAALGVLDRYRFFDTSVRISPDGRFVQFADWRRERPINRIVDLSAGTTIDAGELRDVRTPDAWAADSSGVFVAGENGVVFRAIDGQVAVIDGLGPLRSVAALPGG
jgi:hypothetical protein